MNKNRHAEQADSLSRSPGLHGAGRSVGSAGSLKIDHMVMLARLELTEEENAVFSQQLRNIIEYMDTLNELDTTTVTPTAHILPMKNVFREDIQKESLPKESALLNAPDKSGGFYRVPKIIE